jgi:hypothetical protein
VPPENGSAPPDDSVAEPSPEPVSELPDGMLSDLAAAAPAVPAPQPDDVRPAAVGREQILASFRRNGTPPQPAPLQPRPAERPWFAKPSAIGAV